MAVTAADEPLHRFDPGDWTWNESWFFSFVDLDGGPACTFRVGVMPNQERAMLWCFLFVDGEWVALEESRLGFGHFDFSGRGVSYDRWGLRFASIAETPLKTGRFTAEGFGLVRSGDRTGARLPFEIDVTNAATAPRHDSGLDATDLERTIYPCDRFEQSLVADGTVVVDGREHPVHAGAHRDKSWGPRDWRHCFFIGDLQATDRQLYFVGRSIEMAGGYLIEDTQGTKRLRCVGGDLDFDDDNRTLRASRMAFECVDDPDRRLDVALRTITPSVQFDIAHAVAVPEHWLYYRTLVEAEVSGWTQPVRGWFETGRYGVA